jgi:predicted dienelactone hydrolase
MRRFALIGVLTITVCALLLGVAHPAVRAQSTGTPLYGQRGPYPVGTREFVIEDSVRPLHGTVWYPALNPTGAPESTTYDTGFFPLPGQAIRDAAPDPSHGPYPLVVFSHGLGGFRFQSVFYTEHLASYGFVVVAVNHPGSTTRDFLTNAGDFLAALESVLAGPGGFAQLLAHMERQPNFNQNMSISFALRPVDILREIAYAGTLTAAGGVLAGMIDTSRVAVTGHSFGGYTAIASGGARLDFAALDQWCRQPEGVAFHPGADPAFTPAPIPQSEAAINCLVQGLGQDIARARGLDAMPSGLWPPTTDPRIRAVVALAPWNSSIFGLEGLATLTVPTMIQVGSGDTETPPERDAYTFYTEIGSTDKALVVFQGAEHDLFVNSNIPLLPPDPAWNKDQAHILIDHLATAFLLATLNDDATAAAALAPEAVDFARVWYQRSP